MENSILSGDHQGLKQNTALVRAFSDDFQEEMYGDGPHRTLIRSLSLTVQQDREREQRLARLSLEWPLLFADVDHLSQIVAEPQEEQLLRCSAELAKAWKRFQLSLPEGQRTLSHDTPPQITVLSSVVKSAALKWQAQRDQSTWGKVKTFFTKLSRSAGDHSEILAIIPQHDKYTSLVVGSMTAIAQASIRHEDLASALSECFEQLCEDIAEWKVRVLKHLTVPFVQAKVRELYILVFQFLTAIFTEWHASSWKRFQKSFDKNAANKLFQPYKDKLDRLTTKLDGAIRDHEHEIVQKDLAQLTLLTNVRTDEILLMLGRFVRVQLEEHRVHTSQDQPLLPQDSSARLLATPFSQESDKDSISDVIIQPLERQEILARIPDLDKHAQRAEELERLLRRSSQLQIDKRVALELQKWLSVREPASQWIEGPAHASLPSQNTLAAVAIAAVLQQRHCVVSYFCRLTEPQGTTQGLRSLIKSLIIQLTVLLPPSLYTATDLSSERFELAMRNDSAIHVSLSLLSDLQRLVSRAIIYVIDGMQVLEDRSDRGHTRDLHDFTSHMCNGILHTSIHSKLCLFTDGYVDVLARAAESATLKAFKFDLESDELMADDVESFGVVERLISHD